MIILPTAYFGNIEYYHHLLSDDEVLIEQYEHFPKQTYRNRTIVMGSNGTLPISVPILKRSEGCNAINEVRIDYSTPWQRNGWRAIVSNYRNSAYFDHYEEEIVPFFTKRYDTLWELNKDILDTTLGILGVKSNYRFTDSYERYNESVLDMREQLSPKRNSDFVGEEYYQVFSDRLDFVPNLSILDLILCEGTSAINYIK